MGGLRFDNLTIRVYALNTFEEKDRRVIRPDGPLSLRARTSGSRARAKLVKAAGLKPSFGERSSSASFRAVPCGAAIWSEASHVK